MDELTLTEDLSTLTDKQKEELALHIKDMFVYYPKTE